MGDVKDADSGLALDAFQEFHDLARVLSSRALRGSSKQKGGGAERQGATEGDTLLFPAAEAGRVALQEVADLEHLGKFRDASSNQVASGAADDEGEGQLVSNGHRREERSILGNESDVSFGRLEFGHVGLPEDDPARNDRFQSGNRFQERCLTAAGLAHQHAVLARRNVEGDVREREGAEAECEVVDADHFSGRRIEVEREWWNRGMME